MLYMTNSSTFSDKIIQLRKISGLTKNEMAKILNVSPSNYSRIENGQINKINVEQIAYLCANFKLSPEYFFDVKSKKNIDVDKAELVKIKYSNADLKIKKIIHLLLDISDN